MKEQIEAGVMGCMVWDMLYMRCSDITLYLVLCVEIVLRTSFYQDGAIQESLALVDLEQKNFQEIAPKDIL